MESATSSAIESPTETLRSQVIPEIVTQHAEEAAFLWLLRDAAVRPRITCSRIWPSSMTASRPTSTACGSPASPGGRSPGAALEIGQPGEALRRLGAGVRGRPGGPDSGGAGRRGGDSRDGPRGDLGPGLAAARAGDPEHQPLLAAADPAWRRIGIAAAAIHRQDPGTRPDGGIRQPRPALRAAGLPRRRGAGADGTSTRGPQRAGDPRTRPAGSGAAWSAALIIGDRDGLAVLRAVAEGGGRHAERALQLAMRRMDLPTAKAWQKKLAADPKLAHRAVLGAGAIGDPEVDPLADRADGGPRAGPRRRGGLRHDHRGGHRLRGPRRPRSPRGSRPGPPRIRRTRTWPWTRTRTCPGPTRRPSASGGRAPGRLLDRDPVPGRPAHRPGVAAASPARRLSAPAGGGGPGAGDPESGTAPVRGAGPRLPATESPRWGGSVRHHQRRGPSCGGTPKDSGGPRAVRMAQALRHRPPTPGHFGPIGRMRRL